jgi:hypothetical protein
MEALLRSVSVAMLAAVACAAAETPYWIEPCTNPATGCVAGDVELARWALEAWQVASGGNLHFVQAKDKASALLRIVWAGPNDGLYGEAVPILVNGRRGSQLNVRISEGDSKDRLLRDTVVYLTCLHESGHALGLPHTAQFADIMYSFQFGGDITEYFNRYRRKLSTRDDIRKNSGLSEADQARLTELTKAR